jgi:hypothetical protein
MTIYVADKIQMQPLVGRTIGHLRIILLAWFARRRAHKAALQSSELIKTPDECRIDFEAPMHERQPQVSFPMTINPHHLAFKIACKSVSKY